MTDSGRTYEEVNVDVNNPILTGILAQGANAEAASDESYDTIINSADTEFGRQTAAVDEWEKTQTDLQNERNEFAIDKIEQQQEWARQDYVKEQSGAWTDYQKQSAQHGVNAEQMAMQGMSKTGYSESSLVSMYNTYQNRVATARESFNRAVVEYDNMITEARLQNNAALAEIANNALQKRLEISMNAFQYKNTLLLEKAKAKREINQNYWARYSEMYGHIQDEIKTKESARQFDEQMTETMRHNKATEKAAQDALQLDRDKWYWQKAQSSSSSVAGGGEVGGGKIQKNSNKTSKSSTDKNLQPKISPTLKSTTSTGKKNGLKETGNNETTDSNQKNTIDMKSVTNLGYGPLSAAQLAKLVANGSIRRYVEDGKIKFEKIYKAPAPGMSRISNDSIL